MGSHQVDSARTPGQAGVATTASVARMRPREAPLARMGATALVRVAGAHSHAFAPLTADHLDAQLPCSSKTNSPQPLARRAAAH
mmetsp:Transcript_10208/g.26435  ORF Transcript_10208/g.26435 Transcript_10208/m.26435 type:complete len:84 (+) Transcript_10208:284-535(+)